MLSPLGCTSSSSSEPFFPEGSVGTIAAEATEKPDVSPLSWAQLVLSCSLEKTDTQLLEFYTSPVIPEFPGPTLTFFVFPSSSIFRLGCVVQCVVHKELVECRHPSANTGKLQVESCVTDSYTNISVMPHRCVYQLMTSYDQQDRRQRHLSAILLFSLLVFNLCCHTARPIDTATLGLKRVKAKDFIFTSSTAFREECTGREETSDNLAEGSNKSTQK